MSSEGVRFTGRRVGRSLVSLVLLPVILGVLESTVQRSDISFVRSKALKELLQSSTNDPKEAGLLLLLRRLLPRSVLSWPFDFCLACTSESFVATVTQ
jgi:hypothetical protein